MATQIVATKDYLPTKPGRPSKYNRAIVKAAYEYLVNYKDLGHVTPTKAGMSLRLGIAKKTLLQWANDPNKPEFAHAVSLLESVSEQDLVNGGLSNDYNSSITKLCLSTNHGYSDKVESQGNQQHTIVVNQLLEPVSQDRPPLPKAGRVDD